MTTFRQTLLALAALMLTASIFPSAAAPGKGPQAAEPCGVSGRCGDGPPHFVNVRRPEDD
jgi:hypothetical protein